MVERRSLQKPGIASHGHTEVADRDLMVRAQRGDRQAFGDLVTRYMQRAYYAALGLVGSHDDAVDMSQEAFARAYRSHESIDPDGSFYGWVYQILRRLCFNFLRDQKSRRRRLEQRANWLTEEASVRAASTDPGRRAELTELRERLEIAIEALRDKEREVLVLKDFEGLRYREIAELLGIPIGTVMSRLYAARRSLASLLEDRL
jgi:RNA polymerase sigma-70 factor (ECF subfamily)